MDTTSNITLRICVAITRLSRFLSQHFALSSFNLKSTLMQYSHKHCSNFVLLVTRTFLGHSFENVLKLISTVGFSNLYCRNTVWIHHSKTLLGIIVFVGTILWFGISLVMSPSIIEFNHIMICILWNCILLLSAPWKSHKNYR